MEKTNAVTQAANSQEFFPLTLKLTEYKSNTDKKYRNENCEKKILIEMGMGTTRINTNNAKGNKARTKDKKYFLERGIEAFIPSLSLV
jgi:hypothetical protein